MGAWAFGSEPNYRMVLVAAIFVIVEEEEVVVVEVEQIQNA